MRSSNLAGLMAAALALGAAPMGPSETYSYRTREPEMEPELPRDRRKRGPAPKPSKPLPSEYRANVQCQWGFTANRIQQLRSQWVKLDPKDRPSWHMYLGSQRRPHHLLERGER